jgi:two-component system cell cycle response regulator
MEPFASPAVPPASVGAAPASRPRVLVVDDSRVIRQAIKKILDKDFDVVLAESGDVAWSLLSQAQQFQMLVTDIEMPGMDGYELICRVRGSDVAHLKSLPVLTITGADDEQTKERAFACGATDFIIKPVDAIQLKARAQSYVRLDKSARDLAERATQLEEQAIADPLTGLRSRRYFLQRGEQDVAYCLRHERDITVIRLGIDRYKEVYRKHGDDVGDKILVWIAGVLTDSARFEDTVARVAGDKFAILATAAGVEDAKRVCQRIRAAVRAEPFLHDGHMVEVTLSFGLASLAQDRAQRIEDLFNLAEQRLTRAMLDGGDRVCVSMLGEASPRIEEVVLDFPAPVERSAPAPAIVEENIGLPTLSKLDGIELPVDEAHPAPADMPVAPTTAATNKNVQSPELARLVSVDKALQLIASGDSGVIMPYLKLLMDQLKPLLDLVATHNDTRVKR